MPADTPKTHSIVYRLRRVTTEYAHVSVPVTDAVMRPPDADGKMGLNAERVRDGAIRYGIEDPQVKWVVESMDVTPHPIQTPVPEDYPLKNHWPDILGEGKGAQR